MKLSAITQELESWAPPSFAESYDNVGLLVGNPQQEVTGTLINLDVTEEVLDEAFALGVNLIITHHPIWFRPRKRLTGEDYVSRILIQAIKKDIALYAIHTNLDNVRSGVNFKIAQMIDLGETQFLSPRPTTPETGSGLIGYLPSPISKADFLDQIKATFRCGGIRYADIKNPHKKIHKVAVCGGAGSFLIPEARRHGVDAFLTSDISYHYFFEGDGQFLLCDIGHYESEQFTSQLIFEFISKKFPKFANHLSQVRTNPIYYH